jgi:hypothetical protein
MGLDASVRCNCIKDGLATPHPFPELLRLDETCEPILESADEIPLAKWTEHDRWFERSCSHGGYVLQKRLGNATFIGHVLAFVNSVADELPILRDKVVYSGTHCGDFIEAEESVPLLEEARLLRQLSKDRNTQQFASDMIELCEASLATGNPIVF